MNEMKVFAYDESVLRTVRLDGEPWFVGKDVAAALGYVNPKKALADHVDEEDNKTGAYSTGEPLPSTSERAQTLDALAKSLAEVRRLHKAGLVRADDAARMALSLFGLADSPVQDMRLALDDSELAASVGAFFRERVAFRLVSNAVSSRDLYEAWREWSGAQNVTRRVFSAKVRRLFPSLVHKQIRSGENGSPE